MLRIFRATYRHLYNVFHSSLGLLRPLVHIVYLGSFSVFLGRLMTFENLLVPKCGQKPQLDIILVWRKANIKLLKVMDLLSWAVTVKIVLNLITKTYLYNSDPLKPLFYIIKLGFTGVYIIFLTSALNHRLWVLVHTNYVLSRNLKKFRILIWELSVLGGGIFNILE